MRYHILDEVVNEDYARWIRRRGVERIFEGKERMGRDQPD